MRSRISISGLVCLLVRPSIHRFFSRYTKSRVWTFAREGMSREVRMKGEEGEWAGRE